MLRSQAFRARTTWSGWWELRCESALVPVAGAVVAVETWAAWRGVVWHPLGGPGITPVLGAALLLASLIGFGSLGCSPRQMKAWREYSLAVAALFVFVAVLVTRAGLGRELASFLLGATEEELVFRLAAPLAFGGTTAWLLHRPAGDLARWGTAPRVVAVVVAAVSFAAGPGHLGEIAGAPWRLAPFITVGILLGYVVLRTGNLVAGLLVHALLNLATVAYLDGEISRLLWALLVVAALVTFARGAERAGRRLGVATRTLR
jgi:membrane protease YdiL (CAAX protease family)